MCRLMNRLDLLRVPSSSFLCWSMFFAVNLSDSITSSVKCIGTNLQPSKQPSLPFPVPYSLLSSEPISGKTPMVWSRFYFSSSCAGHIRELHPGAVHGVPPRRMPWRRHAGLGVGKAPDRRLLVWHLLGSLGVLQRDSLCHRHPNFAQDQQGPGWVQLRLPVGLQDAPQALEYS